MTRVYIRPIRHDDFDDVFQLAQQAGGGMTNLPADEDALRARIDHAVCSFAAGATKPGPEVYLMVLDIDGRAMGTTAVFSSIGLDSGFVNYKVNFTFHTSEKLNKRISRRTLIPTHDFTEAGEVGSLFLSKDVRGGGYGKLLAKARYLFIAQSQEIVSDPVCAELRGWRAPDGTQPFWEALGRKFFEMDFEEADVHNAANGNQFIADLLPRYPIYTCMLPQDAHDCIGKPHDSAMPAYNMLLDEGFEYDNYVDIFDAGPLVDTKKNDIKTVRDSRVFSVAKILPEIVGIPFLLASGTIDEFRCLQKSIIVDGDNVHIDAATSEILRVNVGDQIRGIEW